jgi:multiple sugar transport system permease protein
VSGPKRDSGATRLGYGMVLPTTVVVTVLIIGPLVYSAVLSLYRWKITDITLPKPFTGLDNYTHLVDDPTLLTALRNTIVYVVGSVGVELALGFVIATALYELTRGRRLANAVILLPMIVAPVVTALLWRYLLDPQFGLVSQVLRTQLDWFGNEYRALPALMLVDIWQWTPFVILVLHAGMLSVPTERIEAAQVDGAGRVRVVRSIMLPAIVPQILLVLLFRTMDTYRIFDTVFVLTRGGPGTATETVGLYTYRTGFSFFDMGYAMALSVFILVTVVVISAGYIRLLRRREVF